MPWAPRRPRPWLLAVVLLHALLAAGLLQLTGRVSGHRVQAKVTPNVAPLQLVWLRLAAPTPVKPPPTPPASPRALTQPAPTKPTPAPARADGEPTSIPITVTAAPPAPSPPASSPAPLDLQWRGFTAASAPAAAMTNGDPRLGSTMNRSERFASPLGTDQTVTEQAMADGRRFRSGNSCVDVRSTKEAQLNPWNQSTSHTPSLASSCR